MDHLWSKSTEFLGTKLEQAGPFVREANDRLGRFVHFANEWRRKHLSERQFVYLLSIVIGLVSGIIALIIKNAVHLIELLLTRTFLEQYEYFLFVVYPVVGIMLAVYFMSRVIRQNVEHGIPNTLYAISKKNALIKKHNLYSSLVAASLTVGFGGSAGLEGPTVSTTSAWGANIGTLFKLPYKTRTLLIGCGAAGAMAALYKAPLAALVFAIEILMLDLTTASMIPLLLASASASLASRFLLGDYILFHFPIRDDFEYQHVFYYILLGVATGLVGVYFTKIYFWIKEVFETIKLQRNRMVTAGLLLGLLIFLMPPLYGEGFSFMNAIIEGRPFRILESTLFEGYIGNTYVLLAFVLALVIFKVVATSLTFRAGGIGGTFGPTLFMGAMFGFLFARGINFFGLGDLPESNFTLVAMAGLVAGNLHAPLTAIFLIAEITGGYELFVPLMITASISYVTVKRMVPHSIYTMQLALRGELITHNKDQAVLTLMRLHKEIETDFITVTPYQTLGELVHVIARSKRNLFPVVDDGNTFIGVVNLNEIRQVIFNKEMYPNTYVHDLMVDAPEYVNKDDSMDVVMQKFESSGAWNLPVLENGKYMGFVSKSKLFSAYRNLLKDFYKE